MCSRSRRGVLIEVVTDKDSGLDAGVTTQARVDRPTFSIHYFFHQIISKRMPKQLTRTSRINNLRFVSRISYSPDT